MQRIQIKDTELSLCPIGFGTANAGVAWDHEDAFKLLDLYVSLGGLIPHESIMIGLKEKSVVQSE